MHFKVIVVYLNFFACYLTCKHLFIICYNAGVNELFIQMQHNLRICIYNLIFNNKKTPEVFLYMKKCLLFDKCQITSEKM